MNNIIQELSRIEQTQHIHILYAVESGSRAWGFPSKDSDYDVRFIYTRPKDWYLQLQPTKDSLEYPISELLDISGWDLDKSLLLLKKCNPSLLEWLHSPIIYRANTQFHRGLVELSTEATQPKSLIYHYLHMAQGNYRTYLQEPQVKIKKYFYVLRPLLACLWIEAYQEAPPVNFQTLLELPQLSSELLQEIRQLLERKMTGDELDVAPQIPTIDRFIQDQLAHFAQAVELMSSLPKLDDRHINHFFKQWYGYTL